MRPPPGAFVLLLSYGAGLATGLSHFPEPRIVLLVACATGVARRRGVGLIGAVAVMAGVIVGTLAARPNSTACAEVFGERNVRIGGVLDAPGSGGIVTMRADRATCHGTIRLLWPDGPRARSGAHVTVNGRWMPKPGAFGRPDGFLVVRSVTVDAPTTRRLRDLVHETVAERSRQLFGARAPLVDALVTGRRASIPNDLKLAFTASGLVHLLSISGFHVGLIAGWILLVLRLLRVPRHLAEASAAGIALCYVAFLGWQAPAARAGWLLVLVAWNRWRQRNVDPVSLLSTTCLVVLLIDPWAVGDVGGWLSATALGGAILAARWSDKALGTGWGWRTLAGSIGATFGTAPITAMAFGQVALIGILLNFLAIPLAAAAVPGVIVSLLLVPVLPTMAQAFAASGGAALAAVESLARVGSRVPFGQWIGEPGAQAAIPWMLFLTLTALAVAGKATVREAARRAAWIVAAYAWVSLAAAIPRSRDNGGLTLDFLDVGQVDATVIRTPHGRWIVVDAGPSGGNSDAGRRIVVPFLEQRGVRRVDLFVLSHAHRDHVGGAAALVRAMTVDVVMEPGEPFDEASYLTWLEDVAARRSRWRVGTAGQMWVIDGVQFAVLHPAARWSGRGTDLNENSVVLQVSYGAFSAVLAGDAGLPAEAQFALNTVGTDVLKVGHHGSRGATGDPLLGAMRPAAAVISLGRNNYGHPAPATLGRLRNAGVLVWRTDIERTVTVRTDGLTFEVRGRRTRATFDATRPTHPRR